MSAQGGRRAAGIAAYAQQFGVTEDDVEAHLAGLVGERMAGEAIESAGGGAWSDEPLTLRERSLVVVACLATQGGVDARLRGHLRYARHNGATYEELEEVLTLLAIYAGYPRASTAMEVLRDELGAA